MDFTKTTWVNGSAPGISAAELDRIEEGIKAASWLIGSDAFFAVTGTNSQTEAPSDYPEGASYSVLSSATVGKSASNGWPVATGVVLTWILGTGSATRALQHVYAKGGDTLIAVRGSSVDTSWDGDWIPQGPQARLADDAQVASSAINASWNTLETVTITIPDWWSGWVADIDAHVALSGLGAAGTVITQDLRVITDESYTGVTRIAQCITGDHDASHGYSITTTERTTTGAVVFSLQGQNSSGDAVAANVQLRVRVFGG